MTLNISRTQHSRDPQANPTVAHVQSRLIGKGYNVGTSGADGVFGAATETAVKRFQAHVGVAADGVVGPITLRHLDSTISYGSVNADDFANKAYTLVTTGIDGSRPRYVLGAEVGNLSNPSPDFIDCLPADTMVYTATGARPIVDVQVGDEVWSYDAAGGLVLAPVTAFLERGTQQTYQVRTRNRSVRATAGHRLLRLTRGPARRNAGRFVPVDWSTEWVRVEDIKRDDWLVTLRGAEDMGTEMRLADGTNVDEDVAWVLGVAVGDGSVNDGGISICVYGELRERVESVIARVWGVERFSRSEQHGTTVSNRALRDTLTALGMRVRGPQKRIPDLVWLLPEKQQRAFLQGYADADGHFDKRGHQTYHSASMRLVADARAMHIALGDKVSNITTNPRTKPIIIKGKRVQNALPLHSFGVYPGSNRGNETRMGAYGMQRALPDEHFTVERVLGVKEARVEPTYDLTVDGTHTFVAEGVVAHNCSELVQWSVFQITHNSWVDGSWIQAGHCRIVSVDQAARTKGALLFVSNNGHTSGVHHVAISMGKGRSDPHGTAEARSKYMDPNCGSWEIGSRFSFGGLIPILHY